MVDSRDFEKSECRTYDELKPEFEKFARGSKMSYKDWIAERDRCRKDLFYLGRDILKKDWVESPHKTYCSYFVQKNFDGAYRADYGLAEVHAAIGRQTRFDSEGNPTKEMLLLAPRGSYKSTVDGVDCVQWLLNCPDIRILIITGEFKLGQAFLFEIKQYFAKREGQKPTQFHRLFPEYIIDEREGNSDQPLVCPARRLVGQKEPSIWVNSITANLSGWHCDIKKNDDPVTDENSTSATEREKINKKIRNSNNLCDQWGFRDNIGTPYEDGDYYHERIKAMKQGVPMVYANHSAWIVKPGFEYLPLKQLHENMVDLLFPEKLSFTALRLTLLEDEQLFRRQQLCEVGSNPDTITFDPEVLRAHILMPTYIPPTGCETFITWDWATSTARTADFSCGAVCQIGKEKGIIVADMNYGRWKPSDLAFQIVKTAMQYHPKVTLIEKMPGSEFLQMEVARVCRQCDFVMNIWWREPDRMNDAKARRIKGLQTLLNNDRLWFMGGPWNDELFYQLERYTGEKANRGRKDDLPDALSMVQFFIPGETEPARVKSESELEAELKAEHARLMRGYYDRMFKKEVPVPKPQDDAAVTAPSGLPDIFGGNGMHI